MVHYFCTNIKLSVFQRQLEALKLMTFPRFHGRILRCSLSPGRSQCLHDTHSELLELMYINNHTTI